MVWMVLMVNIDDEWIAIVLLSCTPSQSSVAHNFWLVYSFWQVRDVRIYFQHNHDDSNLTFHSHFLFQVLFFLVQLKIRIYKNDKKKLKSATWWSKWFCCFGQNFLCEISFHCRFVWVYIFFFFRQNFFFTKFFLMIINVMCCHVCLKSCNFFGHILDSHTWSESEIGGNIPDGQKCLKIHGKVQNGRILEKLPGIGHFTAFPWDFKHFSIGKAFWERSRRSLVSLLQMTRW